MQTPSRPYVVFAHATSDQVRAHAAQRAWGERASDYSDEMTFHVDDVATLVWHPLDDSFGAFLVTSPAWQVILADLGESFTLLGDVELMSTVGQAATHAELALWGSRLCEFARGQEFYDQTLHVIVSLLSSDDFEFAAAAVRALSRARWPQLVGPLERVAQRWPALNADCQRALQSIEAA